MLTFSIHLKLPNTLQKRPVVEQNNGRQKSGEEQKGSGIKGTVTWAWRTCNSRELVRFAFCDDSEYRKTSRTASMVKKRQNLI